MKTLNIDLKSSTQVLTVTDGVAYKRSQSSWGNLGTKVDMSGSNVSTGLYPSAISAGGGSSGTVHVLQYTLADFNECYFFETISITGCSYPRQVYGTNSEGLFEVIGTVTNGDPITVNKPYQLISIEGAVEFDLTYQLRTSNISSSYTSEIIDYGFTPKSFGVLIPTQSLNGYGSILYYTQSSTDGNTWSSFVPVGSDGTLGSINSPLSRYLRWKAIVTSQTQRHYIYSVAIDGVFLSDAMQLEQNSVALKSLIATVGASTIVSWYIKTANTEVGLASADWVTMSIGSISSINCNTWVQIQALINANSINGISEVSISYVEGIDIGLRVNKSSSVETLLCTDDLTVCPMKISKGGTTYGIALCDTTNTNASSLRIRTASGTKAFIKKL